MPSDIRSRFLFIVLIICFAWGLFAIFSMRFKSGDIYPPYSSLRSDPLGCRAFHDALVHTGQIMVSRNHTALHRLESMENATILIPGMGHYGELRGLVPQSSFDKIDSMIRNGARLVLCYRPDPYKKTPGPVEKDKGKDPVKQKGKQKNQTKKSPDVEEKADEPVQKIKQVDVSKAWGFQEDWSDRAEGLAEPSSGYAASHNLKAQSWHTSCFFKKLAPEWKTVYTLNGHAVVMERAYGKGSLVVSSDSYFLSNEALKKHANPGLLSYITGDRPRLLFDESHFGIQAEPGIAALIVRYGLQNFVAAVLLVSLLYLWKNASYFVPPKDEESLRDASSRHQASGLASLYKRHVPREKLLGVCVDEWEKTCAGDQASVNRYRDKLEHIRRTARKGPGEKAPDPVAGYREIKGLLSEGDL